jgi:NAD(P)-dependent dehydrogenase (short-subunit alcohol dehydrogenase family)
VPTKTQRIAVVTGGGSGIGAAVAQALAEDGWTVVLAGRRKEALDAVVAGGAGLAGALDAIPTDVTDEASVRRLFETTLQRYGRVDLLFNNAGIGAPSVDIDALELEVWNKVLAVNLTGVFLCTRRRSGPCASNSPKAAVLSTTARYPHMLPGHIRLPIPPQNMLSPASQNLPRSTGGRSTSPADRSISATQRPTSGAERRPELPRLTAPCGPSH